ncbi:MAG: HEAT repeat domain-containing protein [Lachnospiraceae bacterium]|nr:HEAT repeat domain-containing protein [Lachnospiraceae bacterium]
MKAMESHLLYFMLVYLAVIGISLLGHGALYIFRRTYLPRRGRKRDRWSRILHERGIGYQITKWQIRRLRRDIDLAAFSDALLDFQEEGGDAEGFIRRNEAFLVRLGFLIRREEVRAYYAYVLTQLNADGKLQSEPLKSMLKEYLSKGHSMYLRENALKAIYSFRDPIAVAGAWGILSKRKLYHDSKLLGNDLVEYQGDMERLLALLMRHYGELEENFKVALINALRLSKNTLYNPQFEKELYQEKLSTDEKCCIIRLLGLQTVDYTKPLVDILISHMNNPEWEPAAVAALALKDARAEVGKPVLLKALTSRHWYVRKNVAMTLASYGLSEKEQQSVLKGEDPYAADALRWALSR